MAPGLVLPVGVLLRVLSALGMLLSAAGMMLLVGAWKWWSIWPRGASVWTVSAPTAAAVLRLLFPPLSPLPRLLRLPRLQVPMQPRQLRPRPPTSPPAPEVLLPRRLSMPVQALLLVRELRLFLVPKPTPAPPPPLRLLPLLPPPPQPPLPLPPLLPLLSSTLVLLRLTPSLSPLRPMLSLVVSQPLSMSMSLLLPMPTLPTLLQLPMPIPIPMLLLLPLVLGMWRGGCVGSGWRRGCVGRCGICCGWRRGWGWSRR